MDLSLAEENYLKTIFHLSEHTAEAVSTNAIAEKMRTKPASVSDMIKRLSGKGLLSYEKYMGVNLTDSGKKRALMIIRKHRLWEVFLVDKLKFQWDEVHEVAEQLEHVQSKTLIKRLDEFLGYPKFDPHGDPIPDAEGELKSIPSVSVAEMEEGKSGSLVSLNDTSAPFLQYLDKVGIYIGARIKVKERVTFDHSVEVVVDNQKTIFISRDVAENLMIN